MTAKDVIRNEYRKWIFSRALKRFAEDPRASDCFPDLIYGWGNSGWSTDPEYARACIDEALDADGPILECGSGLTTILLGIVAKSTHNTVISLEHEPEWAKRVQAYVAKYCSESVKLIVSPIRSFGDFDWYDFPDSLPSPSLVICDGPPASTKGGRSGLVAIGVRLQGAVVLVDDICRDAERELAYHWSERYGAPIEMTDVYARISIPK